MPLRPWEDLSNDPVLVWNMFVLFNKQTWSLSVIYVSTSSANKVSSKENNNQEVSIVGEFRDSIFLILNDHACMFFANLPSLLFATIHVKYVLKGVSHFALYMGFDSDVLWVELQYQCVQ